MAEKSILCRHCHIAYAPAQIIGISGPIEKLRERFPDGRPDAQASDDVREFLLESSIKMSPWSAVELPAPKTSPLARLFAGKPKRTQAEVADLLSESWDPYCPKLHFMLDALADEPFFITVAGESGASKSSFLLGMTNELLQSAALGPFDHLVPSLRPSQLEDVRQQINHVYFEKNDLPPTPENEVKDSFVVRLEDDNGNEALNVGFVDVAGEVIRKMSKTAARGRFVYSSNAIILLLDPMAFPSDDSYLESRDPKVPLITPDILNQLSVGITTVRGQTPKELNIPLVIAVGKSDTVTDWSDRAAVDGGDGAKRNQVISSAISSGGAIPQLLAESTLVREYFNDHHMAAIVRTAESKFGKDNVLYTRISAYGLESAKARVPAGCWKPLELILSRTGHVSE